MRLPYPAPLLALLIVAALFSACDDPMAGPPPTDLDWFAPIVAEMHLAEAMTNEIPILVRDSLREVFYSNILADNDMDQAAFDSIMWEIRQEPAWVDSLYTRVGVVLARQSASPEG